jgi:hypothetical protein
MPEGIKRKHFELGKVEHPSLSAINIGIAGTSAPIRVDRKKYPIYSALHRMPEGIKRKRFELGNIEYLGRWTPEQAAKKMSRAMLRVCGRGVSELGRRTK